jgi:hypothetical protein
MEFVRQIVNSNTLEPVLTLPPSFRGVEVEVIVLPVDNLRVGSSAPIGVPKEPVKHSAIGRLKAYANPSLIPEEEGVWEKAAAEPLDDGSLAYLFRDYVDDGIREPIVDFGSAVGNEQW